MDNHNDPGGATNYGISLRWLVKQGEIDGQLIGDFDGDGDVDIDDIRAMDREQASLLYRQHWWDRYDYGRIHDVWTATKIFDMAVNMGAPQAHKLVQRALAAAEHPVTVDGAFGPRSLKAVNACDPCLLKGALRATQAAFYRYLVLMKPKFEEFESGWLRRAYT